MNAINASHGGILRRDQVFSFSSQLELGRPPPVTQIRGILLTSSQLSLREQGLYDAYAKKLAPEHRDAVLSFVATQWVPVSVAFAHYRAIDALDLPPGAMDAMASSVAGRVQGTILGSVLRAAKSVGVTPWSVATQYPRVCERLFIGGAVAVYKSAPKDALFEVHELPLIDVPYFRLACAALHRVALGLFAHRVFVSEVPGSTASRYVIRVSWV